ncbi:MAG: sigma-54 dependent transcriptional regulator, partial [Amylibacter sp.]
RVMLTGPSGAGKEVAARYIHANSDRAKAPFISVNSATIEPERMEEVLFGRETVERGYEPGLLEQAHGGFVFFDEVADMPTGTQSKILRVLVDQQFTRVGGSDKVRVNLRVVSATNKDLRTEIEAGRFREELYHRLNVVPIDVPSLEDRREDIPLIAAHFIAEFHKNQGLPLRNLSDETIAMLQTMGWPGNVRQLRNIIERVLILGADTGDISPSELPNNVIEESDHGQSQKSFAMLPLREAREMFERDYLMAQINRFGGNISKTANFVGMERSALHRKLKSLNVITTNKSGARVAEIEDVESNG